MDAGGTPSPRTVAICATSTWVTTRVSPVISANAEPAPSSTPAVSTCAWVRVTVPAGFQVVAPSGAIFATTASGSIGGASIPLAALATGSAGNLPAGTICTAVSPLAGLAPQSVVLDGMSGGTDLEATEAWRIRILARIRQPAMGGAANDYVTWAKAALDSVVYAAVLPNWLGMGTVGVVIGMAGPRVPTSGEVAAVAAYIAPRRPVTAAVTVLAASLAPVNISLHISPDTTATRAAVLAALQLSFAQDAQIGGTVFASRLDNAISGSGEYSHERFTPSADVAVSATQLPTLGSVSFT